MKILTLDIESSPIEAYVWGIWDQNVGIDFIKTDWTILAYAAKFLDERKVHYGDTGGRGPGKVRDDKKLVGEIRELTIRRDVSIKDTMGARMMAWALEYVRWRGKKINRKIYEEWVEERESLKLTPKATPMIEYKSWEEEPAKDPTD